MKPGQFYIGGEWLEPMAGTSTQVRSPATGELVATVALGGAADVDRAVRAARAAFPAFSRSSVEDRAELLERILASYAMRKAEIAEVLVKECGFPVGLSAGAQVAMFELQTRKMIETLRSFRFDEARGVTRVAREAVGVCALITPWNWPLNQIACKIAPAIAAGCTMVLKPSELAPLNALIVAEVMHDAGVPAGVFNLVNGDGPEAGAALSSHPEVDMVSFTGSTRGGIAVAQGAAPTVKRVHQELGGKSPFIMLPDADMERAVRSAVKGCYLNAGQSCNAPTRLLVPEATMDEVLAIASAVAGEEVVGLPEDPATTLGPVISARQRDAIERIMTRSMDEGATLACGGPGMPAGVTHGHYVKPTVFGHVTPDMTVFRDEVFGPVLSVSGYRDIDHALELANDTPYGLAGYVHGADLEAVRTVARGIRAGTIYINDPDWDANAPFGGYKMSGNGREYADFALNDFVEVKGIVGYGADIAA